MRRKDMMRVLARTLVRRRASIRKALDEHARLTAENSHTVGDSADVAVDCEQDEFHAQLAAVESRELAAIDAALDRFREGRYGICEGCEKAIPSARLQALPYATLCITCQREEERADRGWGESFHANRETDELFDEEHKNSNGLELELA